MEYCIFSSYVKCYEFFLMRTGKLNKNALFKRQNAINT